MNFYVLRGRPDAIKIMHEALEMINIDVLVAESNYLVVDGVDLITPEAILEMATRFDPDFTVDLEDVPDAV